MNKYPLQAFSRFERVIILNKVQQLNRQIIKDLPRLLRKDTHPLRYHLKPNF